MQQRNTAAAGRVDAPDCCADSCFQRALLRADRLNKVVGLAFDDNLFRLFHCVAIALALKPNLKRQQVFRHCPLRVLPDATESRASKGRVGSFVNLRKLAARPGIIHYDPPNLLDTFPNVSRDNKGRSNSPLNLRPPG